MLSKILKSSINGQISLSFQQFYRFGQTKQNEKKQVNNASPVQQVEKQQVEATQVQKQQKEVVPQQQIQKKYRYQYTKPGYENLAENAYMEYKQYPFHIKHMDPSSLEYVHCELTEYKTETTIKDYNLAISRLKNDLKVQEQVYEILENMDRPYLSGQPGIDRNISKGLQDYFPPLLPGRQFEDSDSKFLQNKYANEHRFINQTVFYPKYAKMTHYDVDFQKELDSRPVNDHFHHDKGYKFDVITPYEERYPYLADRLGHPEILGTPFERLMRLEGEIYHPNYLDQAFVQIPKADPHSSLNFEEGEVLYENTKLLEWSKLAIYGGLSFYAFAAMFVPYSLIYKTHLPLEHAYDNIFLPYYTHSAFFFDNYNLHIPIIAGIYAYSTYYALSAVNRLFKDYVVKAQYNKDKELLFVTRVSPFGSTEEEVYELAHLELLPPSVKSGLADLSSQDPDGLIDVSCLNTQSNLVMYQEEKYWNPSLRKEFINKITGLWTSDYVGRNRHEEATASSNEINLLKK